MSRKQKRKQLKPQLLLEVLELDLLKSLVKKSLENFQCPNNCNIRGNLMTGKQSKKQRQVLHLPRKKSHSEN